MADAKPDDQRSIVDHLAKKTGTTKKVSTQFFRELVALSYKEAKKSFVLPDSR